MKVKTFNTYMKDINTVEGLKELLNMDLTEKQAETVKAKIKELETVQDQPETAQEIENGDLLELIEEKAQEEPETVQDEPENEPENETGKTKKKLSLTDLQEIESSYNNLSKHEKLKAVDGSELDLRKRLNELGIYGIFEGKKAKNDIGAHYIDYALPTLEGLEYNQAYKKMAQLYRKNPNFKKMIEENAQGEIITIAGYGGLFLNFIKPYSEPILLEGMNGEEIEITKENWHIEPLAVWANGGRMIKVFHTLGMVNYLNGNYYQKPTEKFQLNLLDIRNKHWLHFEKRGETVGLITKNGNFKEVPKDLENGWASLIDWAQKNVM